MELVAIIAWPLVALCALGAVVWVAYDWRRPTELHRQVSEALEIQHALAESLRIETVDRMRLGERVGQLEIAQGVKRRG